LLPQLSGPIVVGGEDFMIGVGKVGERKRYETAKGKKER
jgi:hypothetical protein